jgi:hypothetical protein
MRKLLFILALLPCVTSVSLSQTPNADIDQNQIPVYDVGGYVNLPPDVNETLPYQIWPELDYWEAGIPAERLFDCLMDVNGGRNPISSNIIFEKEIKVGDKVAIDWATPGVKIKIFGTVKSIEDGLATITVTKVEGEWKGVITGMNGPGTDWAINYTVADAGGPWSVALCLALFGLYVAGRRTRSIRRTAVA